MLWLGSFACALGGIVLLGLALAGRPMRGESFVGAHLVTGPFALVFCAGAALVVAAAPLPAFVAWALLPLAPGVVAGATFVPLAAYGGRRAWLAKAATIAVVASPFAVGHGAALHPVVPWTGALVLAAVGIGGSWLFVEEPLRRVAARTMHVLRARPHEPSEWECQQADWQRGEWARLPADAGVAAMLPHVRSLAPEVREACLERLDACADLDVEVAAALRGDAPSDALWYVTFERARSRSQRTLDPFAAPLGELLARLRTTWPERLRADPHPRPWTGDLLSALECAGAVLRARCDTDAGDVRSELVAWQAELATMPKFARLARDLARCIAKAK